MRNGSKILGLPAKSGAIILVRTALLSARHDISQFDCGDARCNGFLAQHKGDPNDKATRTYVALNGQQVIGFATITLGSVAISARAAFADASFPMLVLMKVAIDRNYQRKGVAKHLLRQVGSLLTRAAASIQARGLLATATSPDEHAFLSAIGMQPLLVEPSIFMVTVDRLVARHC